MISILLHICYIVCYKTLFYSKFVCLHSLLGDFVSPDFKSDSESKLHNLKKLLNIIPSTPFSLFLNSYNSPKLFQHLCFLHQFKKQKQKNKINLQWFPSAYWMKFQLHRLSLKIFHNLTPTLIPSLSVNWSLPLPLPGICYVWSHQCFWGCNSSYSKNCPLSSLHYTDWVKAFSFWSYVKNS